jgi:hypothetical protein
MLTKNPYHRPETALDRTATIIQEARRGEITAYDAAERVFASLGLLAEAPIPAAIPATLPPLATFLTIARAMIAGVTTAFQPAFRDERGYRLEDTPEWTEFTGAVREARYGNPYSLPQATSRLIHIVEGPHAPRWSAMSARLKDQRSWCEFYTAANQAKRDAAPVESKQAPVINTEHECQFIHHSEHEARIAEVRQQLADSEIERTTMVPRTGWQKLADEVASLRAELDLNKRLISALP